jgi:hypothetical protein
MGNETKTTRKKSSQTKEKSGPGVMNVILVIIGVILVVFTIEMIRLFTIYGAVPDTLVTCVFAACGGEFGIMGWIKTTKERNQSREWELADKEQAMKPAQEPPDDGGR